jgi:hypothetical protein
MMKRLAKDALLLIAIVAAYLVLSFLALFVVAL